MIEPVSYRIAGRRPAVWAFLVAGVGFGALMVSDPPTFMVWAIWLAYMGLIAAVLVINPVHGFDLTHDTLVLSPERDPQHVPVASIDHLDIREDGDDEVYRLHLTDGSTIKVLSMDMPSARTTERMMRAAGLRVVRR